MIVKRFGCTAIHNKALYMCTIHSNTESSSAEANARYASESSFEEKKLSTSAFLKVITNRARSVKHCCPCSSEPPSRTVLLDGHLLFSSPGRWSADTVHPGPEITGALLQHGCCGLLWFVLDRITDDGFAGIPFCTCFDAFRRKCRHLFVIFVLTELSSFVSPGAIENSLADDWLSFTLTSSNL